MALIRLLVPVAGDLADGLPAPACGLPFEVPDDVADDWCDGDRAERVEAPPAVPDVAALERVHTDAAAYVDAVLEQHAAEVEQLHADARAYLDAVLEQHAAELAGRDAQLAEMQAERPPARRKTS